MNKSIFENYAHKVAKAQGIETEELYIKCKSRWLVDGRYMLYYLCYMRPMQITYIQRNMADNGYDVSHSTIIHGIKQAKKKMAKDKDWSKVITELICTH